MPGHHVIRRQNVGIVSKRWQGTLDIMKTCLSSHAARHRSIDGDTVIGGDPLSAQIVVDARWKQCFKKDPERLTGSIIISAKSSATRKRPLRFSLSSLQHHVNKPGVCVYFLTDPNSLRAGRWGTLAQSIIIRCVHAPRENAAEKIKARGIGCGSPWAK